MQIKARHHLGIALGVGLVGLNLLLFNILLSRANVRVRLDLTEGKQYTITPVTRAFLRDLPRPAEITFYRSSPGGMPPVVKPIVEPLEDIIAELAAESGGRVTARVVELDTAGKAVQDEVQDAYGISPLSIPVASDYESAVKAVYFSVLVKSGDQHVHHPLAPSPLVRITTDETTFAPKLSLTDPEFVLASSLRQVATGFNSLGGAIAAQELQADITAYLSDADSLPSDLKGAEEALKKAGAELEKDAPGRVRIEVVDPWKGVAGDEPRLQAAKALYQQTGISPLSDRKTEYYAWIRTRVGEQEDLVPLPSATQFEIKTAMEGSLKRVVPGFRPKLGIVTPAPPSPNPMMMQRPPEDPFQYVRQSLEQHYEIETVNLDAGAVPGSVETILVIQPTGLSDRGVYALDQFLLRGGHIVLCTDGFSDNGSASLGISKLAPNGTLRAWLGHMGIWVRDTMVMDRQCDILSYTVYEEVNRMRIPVGLQRAPYPFFVRLDSGSFAADHPVTGFLENAVLMWPTVVSIRRPLGEMPGRLLTAARQASARAWSAMPGVAEALGCVTTFWDALPKGPPAQGLPGQPDARGENIAWTTTAGSLTDDVGLARALSRFTYDPGIGPMGRAAAALSYAWAAVDDAVQTERPVAWPDGPVEWTLGLKTGPQSLAATVSGRFQSFWASRAIPTEAPAPSPDGGAEDGPSGLRPPLSASRRDGSIVVIGDSDFLSPAVIFGYDLGEGVWANNLEWTRRALELGQKDGLSQIRSGRLADRPLHTLAGLTSEERAARASSTTNWTFLLTFGGILAFALGWLALRSARRPMDLFPREMVGTVRSEGGQAS